MPLCLLFAVLLPSCGSDDPAEAPVPGACPYSVAAGCVGVPLAPLCDSDPCTQGATCAQTISVAAPGALAPALASAQSGDCVALAPGAYGSVTLPAGVSLLGRGAASVTLEGLTIDAGAKSIVRGVAIGAGGVVVGGAGEIALEAVRVQSPEGVSATGPATLSITRSEILGADVVGVSVAEGASLTMVETVVAHGDGPGIAARCALKCACTETPVVTLDRVLVKDQAHVGVFFEAADATLSTVAIEATRVRDLEANSGGGLVAAACSTLDAKGTSISNNAFFGALIDGSTAKLGSAGEANSIIIHTNVLGLWVQGQTTTEIDNAKLVDNQGVGIGTSGAAVSIIIHTSEVKNTLARALVVAGGGSKEVGDGFVWAAGAKAIVDGLAVSTSARQGILIDGAVGPGSSLANVSLAGGDEADGIVQQSLPDGGTSPAIGSGAPMLSSSADQLFPVPAAPAPPD